MQSIDPYLFPANGYRCTVTVARLVPGLFWFASCTRCNKSCAEEGPGYRCKECSSTSFKFKYKLCFIAADGTAEAQMICFGEVARRIVGKPVQQIMRMARNSTDEFPPDIAAIVSLKFAFSVVLTHESYYKKEHSYRVTSIATSYGRQRVIPQPMMTTGASSSAQGTGSVAAIGASQAEDTDAETIGDPPVSGEAASGATTADVPTDVPLLQPNITPGTALTVVSRKNTPPPIANDACTPVKKSGARDQPDTSTHISARRKLLLIPSGDSKDTTLTKTTKKQKTSTTAAGPSDADLADFATESVLEQDPPMAPDALSDADSAPLERDPELL